MARTVVTNQKHINFKHYAQLTNAKFTPTIGWAGFTRKAGEVNIIPSTITSIWGWEAAYTKFVKNKFQNWTETNLIAEDMQKISTLTFKTTAPPVEWPKRKHGIPGFSDLIFSRKAPCS